MMTTGDFDNKKLDFTGERYIPQDGNDSEIVIQHMQRYLIAKELCHGKKVLDIACGEGYGSEILSSVASSVCGVDISEDVIEYARKKYGKDNLEFMVGNVSKIPYEDNCFDVVVSFETIEHVSEINQRNFLNEIIRVLKEDGVLIISSPNKLYYSDMSGINNNFHVKELYEEEFYKLLKNYFINVDMYYQGMHAISYCINDKRQEIQKIDKFSIIKNNNQYNAEINIAVCGNIKLPEIKNNYVIDYGNKYYILKYLVNSLQRALKEPALIIEQKENYICEQREKINSLEDRIREINGIVEQKENYICEQREKINSLEDNIREINGIVEQKENYICEQREKINSLEDSVREINGIVEQKENYICEQREKINSLEDRIREINGIVEQKENYIREQREKINSLEDSVREINGIVEQKENYICEQREKVNSLKDCLREINGIAEQKENFICEQRNEINMYRQFISNRLVNILYKTYIKLVVK